MKEKKLSPFAQRVQDLMDQKGWSKAELARQSGREYHEINTWFERENSLPRGDALVALCRALEVDPFHLIEGVPAKEAPEFLREQVSQRVDALSEEELRVLLAAADAFLAQSHDSKELDPKADAVPQGKLSQI